MASRNVLSVTPGAPEPEALAKAAQVLRSGGLVAFPTETVYGLGADARNPEAVRRIFAAKGRPADNPLIVHVPDIATAQSLVTNWPARAQMLAEAFWPGPLTLLLPKRPEVPDLVTAGLPAVGLRVPAHPVALALLRAAELPVAAPSANPYMGISPTTADHVARGLGDRVDLILDGGPTQVGIESTVLDLTGAVPLVLRPGGVSLEALQRVLPEVRMAAHLEAEGPRLSPGLAKRHYSPQARLHLIEGRGALLSAAQAARDESLALMPLGSPAVDLPGVQVRPMPASPEEYAQQLYATLHDLDAAGATLILAERPPETPDWHAVLDRLTRAAAER
ncbi:MAG TPA: L-threonylcarbamoyladenylate synthase [Stenomitos sp.]